MADSCLKKRKHEKRESILLDSRQPFMNRVGLAPPFLFAELFGVKVCGLFEIVRWAVESFFDVFVIRGANR
jgi:hypothetical protein